jgi:hypothetical protein
MALADQKATVAISLDLFKCMPMIPHQVQKKVGEFIIKFKENPLGQGINYEKIHAFKDQNLRSVRIDLNYRGIVLHPKAGNIFMLLWVDHHDKAYKWAENKLFKIHPETGGIQIIDIKEEIIEKIERSKTKSYEGLYEKYSDDDLLLLGVPEEHLILVRSISTEKDLDAIAENFPQEVSEALYMLAAGFTFDEVRGELDKKPSDIKIDTDDFTKALKHPDTKRRFYVVEDARELIEIINSPLDLWRVFLHPSQRKLVEADVSGPVRVLGGAGTGKTVVAMHRATWLAQKVFSGPNDRLLFTTFTKNLAADIGENLRKICSTDILKKIEVINLDAWVMNFLKKNGYEYTIAFNEDTDKLWDKALNVADSELGLAKAFYKDEWLNVVQTHGIGTKEEYLSAKRIGRGTRLTRKDRTRIWLVFEEYRSLLNQNNLKEMIDASRDVKIILEQKGNVLPYRAIIVDEAQDMAAEAYKLLRKMVPEGRNDMFIVGDAHQRIYNRKIVLSRCGIDIKGRGKRLKINYRTTEETRKWAVRLLEGTPIDDLDGGLDSQVGYKSLMHGVPPEIILFASFKEETAYLNKHLRRFEAEKIPLNSVCLVARTVDMLKQYESVLRSEGIPCYPIRRSIPDDRSKPGLRLATMHRVKGLEFDYVIISGVNEGIIPYAAIDADIIDESGRVENEIRERALLHVAATRAKKEVLITSFGAKSRFL